jgi:hypothetical protein
MQSSMRTERKTDGISAANICSTIPSALNSEG